MKRSERFKIHARNSMLWALLTLSVAICAGAWSVRAWQSSPSGGVAVGLIALTGLILAADMAVRALDYHIKADEERSWETDREVRPKI